MGEACWPYFDPDFDNMSERITPSCRVCIDNNSKEDCTLIKVDRVNKQDLLLEIVQIITDLNLSITKGYVSSDAEWFMDVFHVKDKNGNKLRDQTVLDKIQQGIGSARVKSKSPQVKPSTSKSLVSEHTAIEMTTIDRPGLLSEISAVLTDLHCNIVEAHAWCHNARLACVLHISDQSSLTPIHDPSRLASIEQHLTMVLGAKSTLVEIDLKQQELKASNVIGEGIKMITNVERRLHQLMLSNRDFESPTFESSTSPRSPLEYHGDEEAGMKAIIHIEGCHEKGYSIISVECRDRARVVFDTLCTLIDMEYVIFHGYINTRDGHAFQEYFIQHRDSTTLQTQAEKDRVIKCLEAAVERRVCEGIKLEVCAKNRVGLLSDITRFLRENDLTVVRADIATHGEKAIDAFYVRDSTGKNIDMEFMESVKQEMSLISFKVKNETTPRPSPRYQFSLVGMIKFHLDRFSLS